MGGIITMIQHRGSIFGRIWLTQLTFIVFLYSGDPENMKGIDENGSMEDGIADQDFHEDDLSDGSSLSDPAPDPPSTNPDGLDSSEDAADESQKRPVDLSDLLSSMMSCGCCGVNQVQIIRGAGTSEERVLTLRKMSSRSESVTSGTQSEREAEKPWPLRTLSSSASHRSVSVCTEHSQPPQMARTLSSMSKRSVRSEKEPETETVTEGPWALRTRSSTASNRSASSFTTKSVSPQVEKALSMGPAESSHTQTGSEQGAERASPPVRTRSSASLHSAASFTTDSVSPPMTKSLSVGPDGEEPMDVAEALEDIAAPPIVTPMPSTGDIDSDCRDNFDLSPSVSTAAQPVPLPTVSHPAPNPNPGGPRPVDIIFSFDTTGSMSLCIEEVQREVHNIINRLFMDIPSLRIGIIAHGDYCDREHFYVTSAMDLTNQVDQLCGFVKEVTGTGGGDWEECYELVLRKVREEFSWSPGSQRSLVMIGDAIPHPVGHGGNADIDWRVEADRLFVEMVSLFLMLIITIFNKV